jgi:hypothetical protein
MYLLATLFAVGCTDEIIVPCDPNCNPVPLCNYDSVRIHNPGEMIYGRVTGLKNCTPFVAIAEAYISPGKDPLVGIVMNTYEDWGHFLADKENISIVAQANGYSPIGNWHLVQNNPPMYYQVYTIYQDHDVFEDSYSIDEEYESNEFSIIEIDSVSKKIRGYFEARFWLSSSQPSGRNPDTILFSNCVFEAWHPE